MNNETHDAVQLLAQRILNLGHEEIPMPERQVIERVAKRLAVSRNINIEYDKSYTTGGQGGKFRRLMDVPYPVFRSYYGLGGRELGDAGKRF